MYLQELCTVRSARVVVGCVVAAAVVTMVPRLTDRQYSISRWGHITSHYIHPTLLPPQLH